VANVALVQPTTDPLLPHTGMAERPVPSPHRLAAPNSAPTGPRVDQTVPDCHHQDWAPYGYSTRLSTCWWSSVYASRPEKPEVSAFW
jgi:hypothetical protein